MALSHELIHSNRLRTGHNNTDTRDKKVEAVVITESGRRGWIDIPVEEVETVGKDLLLRGRHDTTYTGATENQLRGERELPTANLSTI